MWAEGLGLTGCRGRQSSGRDGGFESQRWPEPKRCPCRMTVCVQLSVLLLCAYGCGVCLGGCILWLCLCEALVQAVHVSVSEQAFRVCHCDDPQACGRVCACSFAS